MHIIKHSLFGALLASFTLLQATSSFATDTHPKKAAGQSSKPAMMKNKAGSTNKHSFQFGKDKKVRISVLYDSENNYRVMINSVDEKKIKVSVHNRGSGTVRTDVFSHGSGDSRIFVHNEGEGRMVVDLVARQRK